MTADPYREWDAAYVLGALAPDERREFEQHLAGCPACREGVGDLAGMPALLGMVPADVAMPAVPARGSGGDLGVAGPGASGAADEPSAALVPIASLAHAAQRRTRRRRTLLAVAAAGLVAASGLGGAATARLGDDERAPAVVAEAEARTVTLTPVGQSGVSADLTLVPARWGTRLDWSCEYEAAELAVGVYELVLVDEAGERTVVATWTSTGSRAAAGLGASSAVPLDGISRVELGVVGLDVPLASAEVTSDV
ncbi:anti-sigma factor family protein [Cellulomonas sp. NS3]|uniref:anti-sigma factor family protein n=1 Tax=Cellulomonas sp. NS3 TaxID=2973977 RepID=UPI002161EF37|nr:zf-HC2 domain-containing protein [Cellulomonas sp. NS3]